MKKIVYLGIIILALACGALLLQRFFLNPERSIGRRKVVMSQLDRIEAIYKAGRDTRSKQPGSDWGDPDPKEAISIINNAISELQNLKIDPILIEYRDMSIEVLKYIKEHHELRLSEKDPSLFDSKAREIYLKHFHIEGEREKEYRRVLKELR